MSKKILVLLVLLVLGSLLAGILYYKQKEKQKEFVEKGKALAGQTKSPPDFLIIMVGDSMTEYLGNFNELRVFLNEYYPDKYIDIYNYGFGSTNILSLPDRLTGWTKHGRDFQPILDIDFDLIIIESFGHNPLSQYPLAEGLKIQTQTLDKSLDLIKSKRPEAKIVFMSTLSPNKKVYGGHLVDLSQEQRQQWSNERIEYIKNHMEYAKAKDIPLIDIFEKSLDLEGNGNLKYIEEQNYIHPSPNGIIFISMEVADFIYKNTLLKL